MIQKNLYCVLLCFNLTVPFNTLASAAEPLNRIIAVVNDDIITESQLHNRENLVLKQLEETKVQLPPRNVLQQQILDRLVLENLQLQIAERSGVRIDDEALNSSLRSMAKENGMTLTEFRSKLENDGYDYITFREQLRNEISMNRIRQQMVENRIQITEQEIDNLLATVDATDTNREYLLSHILISIPESASTEQIQQARTQTEKILEKLKNGADFAKTAIAESDGQQALKGGNLGWRQAGKLPSLFTDVVDDISKGQISGIIRSPSGFHIIKIVDMRGEEPHRVTQTHARHILLKTNTLISNSDAKTRLEQIRERIEHGDNYAALAQAYSQDTGSASQGGDIGWVNPGAMVPEFEEAMSKLQPGEISQPVQSRFGWHLIEVIERRSRDNSAEFRRAQARESIRRRKTDEEMEIWLRRLRDEAYIEYHLNETS